MSEFFLALTLIAFFIYHGWYVWENHKQTKKLIKAIMSKDIQEFTNSEIAETHSKKKQPKVDADVVEMSELDDKEFQKVIKKQVDG
ncbi:hypothetical protein LCGC14_1618030 [marine sediment metagenome]|uniref:Uncharacterized protein n=1 Tax=marine sediment metagenome TaxID=412755 RepID=A0A0F9I6L6_9ZZZZ